LALFTYPMLAAEARKTATRCCTLLHRKKFNNSMGAETYQSLAD
jgi:hypothetical protein